jgi:dGTPase
MNLTCALLLSTVKYPWSRVRKPDNAKKIGIFDMDWPTYERACALLEWEAGNRFPFAFLMEAADDIAYSMSDLEDGLEKHIIRIEDLKSVFGPDRFESQSVHPIVAFKTSVINEAIEAAATAFASNLDEILTGTNVRLLSGSAVGTLLEEVNSFAREKVYSAPAAEMVELAGRSVIKGLLTHFSPLLELSEADFAGLVRNDRQFLKGRDFHIRLLRRLPDGYVEKYSDPTKGAELERRAHLLVDFISGMTDDFALGTFQVLQGIRISD